MKKQLLLIIGIIILLVSCKQTEKNDKTKKETIESSSIVESNIENDSLVIVLKSGLERIALNKKFTILKKPIQNRNVDNSMDVIVTRTYKKTKLTSYKTASTESVYKAKIEDSEFGLNSFIQVGAKKSDVEKVLAIKIVNDILKIENLEQTSVFTLRFESEILKAIEFEGPAN